MADQKTEHSELARLTLAALVPVEQMWGAKVTVIGSGLAAIWREGGKKLHAVATVGFSVPKTPTVHVGVLSWTHLRNVSDRLRVKSAVFVETPQGLFYQSWPPVSGLGYPTKPDPTAGAVVCLPKKEFALVEAPKKQGQ